MKFFIVDENYISHLRKVDDKVRMSKGTQVAEGARPYIGVVLAVNGIDYLAPLTSYNEKKREKFERIRDDSLLSFKMYELGNEDNRLGMVQLNNMIPVSNSVITPVDIKSLQQKDEKYAHLLDIQQQYLRKHQTEVLKRAKKLYGAVNAQKSGKANVNFIGDMSCDFKALESALAEYKPPMPQKATASQLQKLLEKHK